MGISRGINGWQGAKRSRTSDDIDAQEWADNYSRWISMELELADLRAQYELAPVGFTLLDRNGCIRRINISGLHGIECRFACPRAVLLDNAATTHHLFRIAQEAVHNALRHGHCKTIDISLTKTRNSLRLTIENDGQGGQARQQSTGLGLQIMKSRCEAIGASLQISPVLPTGMRVNCELSSTNQSELHPKTSL